MNNSFRDIEHLSSYLDGQLDPSTSARLETRIKSDPELAAALRDLRVARSVIRKLPTRRAPRNFTLTRQMAGLKAPLPRTYPALRFASVFATFIFIFTFAANFAVPYATSQSPATTGYGGGCAEPCGMGGGGGDADPTLEAMPIAPAATEAPFSMQAADSALVTEAPTIDPSQKSEAMPTATAPVENSRPMGGGGDGNVEPFVPQQIEPMPAPISSGWQLGVGILALLLMLVTWGSRLMAERNFKNKLK